LSQHRLPYCITGQGPIIAKTRYQLSPNCLSHAITHEILKTTVTTLEVNKKIISLHLLQRSRVRFNKFLDYMYKYGATECVVH